MIGKTNPNARRLRRGATNAEMRLWNELRNRQLGGLKFRRQVTIGPYVADFACIDRRLVVEADGGHHDETSDATRTAFLQSRGYRVLRFWNNDILSNTQGVMQFILIAADEESSPSPNPLPQAGEGF